MLGTTMKLLTAKFCLLRMTVFLLLVIAVALLMFDNLKSAFSYNIQINSIILACFITGVVIIYKRIFLYDSEYVKLLNYNKLTRTDKDSLQILTPIVYYLSGAKNLATQSKINTVIASVEKRIDDYGNFPKYLSGILIFLGLFGTFWGLSQTIGNVANIIDNLGIDQADASESFSKLKESLRIPLSGMGTAFGCSLFGLSGSLILGFLNINQKRVADSFLYKVEEWITNSTVSLTAPDGGMEYHGQVFSMGLLEKTIEMIYAFQNQLKEFEGNRITLMGVQKDFANKISQLTDAMIQQQSLLRTIGTTQVEMQNMSKRMNETVWTEMIGKLDSIEKSLTELVQGTYTNRDYIVENLGKDIRMISKTLSSLMG